MAEALRAQRLIESPRACVTLLVPASIESRVVDWLLAGSGTGSGRDIEFSVHQVAAHGPLVNLDSSDEQVLGYSQRIEVKMIVDRLLLNALLVSLDRLLSGVEGGYWVMPVERFVVFGSTSAATSAVAPEPATRGSATSGSATRGSATPTPGAA